MNFKPFLSYGIYGGTTDNERYQYYISGGLWHTPSSISLKVLIGGVWKTVANASILIGGAWKTITSLKVLISNAWKATT